MDTPTLLVGPNHRSLDDQAFARAADLAGTAPGSILYITRFDARAPLVADRWASEQQPLRLRTSNLKGVVRDCYEHLVGPSSALSGALNRRLTEYALDQIAPESAFHFESPPVSTALADAFETRFSLFGDVGLTTPEDLEAEFSSTPLDERIVDTVTDAYAAYHELRDEHAPEWLYTGGEAFQKVITANESLDSLLPAVDVVIISGYYEFRPIERAMLDQLTQAFPTLALVPQHADGESGVDAAATDALSTYEELGFEIEHVSPSYGHQELQQTAAALYQTDPYQTPSDPTGLSWRELPTPEREARFVARDIKHALANGQEPSELTVVVPRLDAYRQYLHESFEMYEIPYAMASPTPLDQTLVGSAVESLLALADNDPQADDLTTLLSNPLVKQFSETESTAITATTRRRDTKALDQLCADLDQPLRGAVESLWEDALAIRTDDLTDAVGVVRDLLDQLGISTAIESYASGDTRETEQRAFSMVEEVLDSCTTMAAAPSEATPLEVLQRSFNGVPVRTPRQQATDQVEILGVLDAQLRALDHAYLVGLTAENFPTTPDRPAFFETMTDAHPRLDPGDDRERARYLFASLLANTSDLTITTPSAKTDETVVVQSPILEELHRVTGIEPETGVDDRIGSREDLQRVIAPRADRRDALDAAGSRDDFTAEQTIRADRGIVCATNRRQDELTPHDGDLDEATVDTLYSPTDREPYSVSRLERYVSCGYRFYMEQILDIEAPDDFERTPTSLETGSFVHTVLERFYDDLQDEPGTPVSISEYTAEQLESHLLAVAKKALDAADFQYSGLFYRRWCEELFAGLGSPAENPYSSDERPHGHTDEGLFVQFLDAEFDGDDETQPAWFELPFGDGLPDGGDAPSFEVSLPNGDELPIRGYIDRVDVGDGDDGRRLSLYDYKTGSTPSMTTTTGGTTFQLPIYLQAAETVLADEIESVADLSATYYKVKPPNDLYTPRGIESKFDSQSELRRFLDDVIPERLATIDQAIEHGRFHTTLLSPKEASCSYCDYRRICDVRHHQTSDRIAALETDDHTYVPQRVQEESFADVFGGESDA